MMNIVNPNSERINNIRTFLQGNNLIGLVENCAKELLTLESACEVLASDEQVKRNRTENAPLLAKPKAAPRRALNNDKSLLKNVQPTEEKGFMGNALMIEMFSTLRQLLSEGNINALRDQLQLLNIESNALKNRGDELLTAFEGSTQKLSDAKKISDGYRTEYLDASTQLNDVEQQQDSHFTVVESHELELASVQTQLAKDNEALGKIPLPTVSPEQQFEVDALRLSVETLSAQETQLHSETQRLNTITESFENKIKALTAKVDVLEAQYVAASKQTTALVTAANNDRTALNQFIDTAPRRVEINGEKWENTLALLTLLTAQLKKSMNEDSLKSLKEQEEVMSKISEASRKDSEKKAKEAEEAGDKASDANKAASCASKVFSYVMLAVSVVATVATFGAAAPLTLALAAIGIAMAVTDIVLEETGNASLMQMLATEISSAVTDMLISFGMSEDEAKKIGSIVGMVVAAVAFLALSLASMSSFVKNIANTAMNAVKTIGKTAIKSALKSIPKSLANGLGNLATKGGKIGAHVADNSDSMVKLTRLNQFVEKADEMKDAAKTIEKAAKNVKSQSVAMARLEVAAKGSGVALTMANTATSGGLNLHAAMMGAQMKEMLAGMMLNNATIEAIDELLNTLIKAMSKSYSQLDEMFSSMLSSLNQSGQNKANSMKAAHFA